MRHLGFANSSVFKKMGFILSGTGCAAALSEAIREALGYIVKEINRTLTKNNCNLKLKSKKMKTQNSVKIDRKALYFQALQMSIDTFMEEEKQGQLFTELRLMKAIEAAKTLYKPFKTN